MTEERPSLLVPFSLRFKLTKARIEMCEKAKDEEHLKDVIEMKNKRIELLDSIIEMLLQEKYDR